MWTTILMVAMAKDKVIPVAVIVGDASGTPIPTGFVVFADELEVHRVNTELGWWEGSVLYLPGGGERPFAIGSEATAQVGAAGYRSERIEHVVTGSRKKDTIRVELTPIVAPASFVCRDQLPADLIDQLPSTLPQGATPELMGVLTGAIERQDAAPQRDCLVETRAWSGWQAWVDAEAVRTQKSTEQSGIEADARLASARKAIAGWRDHATAIGADVSAAAALCAAMPMSCDPR